MALLSNSTKGSFYGSTLGDDVTIAASTPKELPSWTDLTKKRQITTRISDPLSALSWDKYVKTKLSNKYIIDYDN